jgi:hypothetical protein
MNFESYLQGRKDVLNTIQSYLEFCIRNLYSSEEVQTITDINNFILKLKNNENNTNSND